MTSQAQKGAAISAFTTRATAAEAAPGIQQAINFSTGRMNAGQIIKYLVYFVILCAIVIFLIEAVRGLLIGFDQFACGMGNTGCSLPLIGRPCRDCAAYNMGSFNWMWEVEWFWRCLLYLGIAYIIGILLYIWGKWLADKLLRVDVYIRKIEDWIYGFKWEGEAERQMEK